VNRLAAVGVLLLVVCAALSAGADRLGKGDTDYATFLRLSYPERKSQIAQLPLEEQVAAYLKMIVERHPPDLELAAILAPGGRPLVNVVRKWIDSERTDEVDRSFLIFLLLEVQTSGYDDLHADEGLISQLERVVGEMKTQSVRASSSRFLDLIKSPPSKGGQTPRGP